MKRSNPSLVCSILFPVSPFWPQSGGTISILILHSTVTAPPTTFPFWLALLCLHFI